VLAAESKIVALKYIKAISPAVSACPMFGR